MLLNCEWLHLNDSGRVIYFQVTIGGMWPPRLSQYINSGCIDLLLEMLNLFRDVINEETPLNLEERASNFQECLDKIMSQQPCSILSGKAQPVCMSDVPNILESLTDLVEVVSVSCLVVSV